MGLVKSAMGIGGLLCLGIGDTIRVTLTADPIEEIFAAKKILKAAGLRKEGVNLIACPTCGRTRIDLIPMAEEVERRLMNCTKNITVAVMGCAVNGPGEAAAADIGIAGGKGEGLIFRKGEIVFRLRWDDAHTSGVAGRRNSSFLISDFSAFDSCLTRWRLCQEIYPFSKCLLSCSSPESCGFAWPAQW